MTDLSRRSVGIIHVLSATRSPKLTWRAMRRNRLGDIEDVGRAGGSLRGGRMRLNELDVPLHHGDVDAVVNLRHLAVHGWDIRGDDDAFMVRIPETELEIMIPRGILSDGLGAVVERFFLDEYAALSPEGAVVVDIGAYIGDSCLYMLNRGAHHVLSFEPFPALADVASLNLRRNGLAASATVTCAGVGWPPGRRGATYRADTSMMSSTLAPGSQEVEIVDLGGVLQRALRDFGGRRLVVKIDCEGAEYEFLAPGRIPPEMERVGELAIEIHAGDPRPIVAALAEAGLVLEAAGLDRPLAEPVMAFAQRRSRT